MTYLRLSFPCWLSLLWTLISVTVGAEQPKLTSLTEPNGLVGHRFLTLNTVVRVRQIEVTRDTAHGPD
ncbi:MAG: hypothetical protein LW870_12355, partial [Pirellula sp.]|nr:hypothetical protein [Pirellula sp.]